MNIAENLSQIGIDGKKAEVYLACLKMGGASAYLIAKKLGLKRPTVYDIINQLMNEGLIHKSIQGHVKHYSPADPEILIKKINERERRIRQIMPELQNLYNSPKIKPFIRYFEGKEGIKEMYEDSLKSLKKSDEILAYVGESVLDYLPEYSKDYVSRRVKKSIRLRGIYKKTPGILKYMDHNQEQLRNARVLDPRCFPLQNETNIYKNKVAIASYENEMFGMIIESAQIATSQKTIFELAWLGAEKLEIKK